MNNLMPHNTPNAYELLCIDRAFPRTLDGQDVRVVSVKCSKLNNVVIFSLPECAT